MTKLFLNRAEAALYLTEKGLKTSKNTLAKLACLGGGPAYQHLGANAVYTPENLDAHVESKLSPLRQTTSEAA